MNKQKNLWILSVTLILLIVGASVLYNYWGDKIEGDILAEGGEENNETDLKDDSFDQEDINEENENKEDVKEEDTKEEDTNTGDNSKEEEEKPLKPAENLRVTDLEGNEVSLADFKGKPVVLNFWTSWCSICKYEMIDFEMIYNQYKDDVVFMLVSVTDGYRETVKKASDYIEKKGYTFPVYYDTLRDAYFIYRATSVPATYFIDADGNLVKTIKGGVDRMILERGIEMILPQE